MSTTPAGQAPKPSFSFLRVLLVALPLVAVAGAGLWAYSLWVRSTTQKQTFKNISEAFGIDLGSPLRLEDRFTDSNDDLVADPPSDPSKLLDPDELVFSDVGADDNPEQQVVWKEFLQVLSEKTGKQVRYQVYETAEQQLRDLRQGKLHVTVINTGNVPKAVNTCGFVPVCVYGSVNSAGDDQFGYSMYLIVPADSPLQSVEDIRTVRNWPATSSDPSKAQNSKSESRPAKLIFSGRTSNSGFRAPVALLKQEFGMLPDRDYRWGFSRGHSDSIRRIAEGEFEVAAVASDLFARDTARVKQAQQDQQPSDDRQSEPAEESAPPQRDQQRPDDQQSDEQTAKQQPEDGKSQQQDPAQEDPEPEAPAQKSLKRSQFRILYKSKRFPPATVGYHHALKPSLAETIEQTLLEFDWTGTGLEREQAVVGNNKFVKVSYDEDWRIVRLIEGALR